MRGPSALTALTSGFFLGGSLIVAIGAQNLYVLRQGLKREHVTAIVGACIAVDVTLIAVGVSGVTAALGKHPIALDAMALAGAAFLLVYAIRAARRALRPQGLDASVGGPPISRKVALIQALGISLLNPHVYLDTVLLVGGVGAQQPSPLQPVFVAGAGLASTVWFAALGYGARWLSPVFQRPAAWQRLDLAVAATMAGLAVWLAAGVWR
jgi:L-lysine exporter family protein LysE/ArgO